MNIFASSRKEDVPKLFLIRKNVLVREKCGMNRRNYVEKRNRDERG